MKDRLIDSIKESLNNMTDEGIRKPIEYGLSNDDGTIDLDSLELLKQKLSIISDEISNIEKEQDRRGKLVIGVNSKSEIALGSDDEYIHEIWCYGVVKEDSAFALTFENELNDGILPGMDKEVYSWLEAIEQMKVEGIDIIDLEQVETD